MAIIISRINYYRYTGKPESEDKYFSQIDQVHLIFECTASFQLTTEVQTPSAEQAQVQVAGIIKKNYRSLDPQRRIQVPSETSVNWLRRPEDPGTTQRFRWCLSGAWVVLGVYMCKGHPI